MKSWMCTHNQREGIIVLASYYFVIHKFQTLQYPLFYCVYRCTFVLPFQYFDTENNLSAVLTFCCLYATLFINQKTSISTTTTINVKVNKIIKELTMNSTLKSTKLVTNWQWITFLSVCRLYATLLIKQKTSISTTTTVNVKVNKIINEIEIKSHFCQFAAFMQHFWSNKRPHWLQITMRYFR